jgi:hypothetical protein
VFVALRYLFRKSGEIYRMDYGGAFSEDPQETEEDITMRTRNGYPVADAVRSFRVALEGSGSESAAKSLHHAADLICSGCLELWQKHLYEYALDHIGIGSPRIFWFLRRRFADLDTAWAKLPAEQFYRTVEYQKAIGECVLIIRSCPRRPALKMPRVAPETHNEEWVRGAVGTAPSSAAVGRVYRMANDLQILRRIGDEFAKSCADGATEKAIWWLKWCLEEDSRMRRDGGGSLSTLDRGPSQWNGKQRSGVGFFFAALLMEIYKELGPKTGLRMNDEFQAILQLYSYPDKRLSQRRRFELLCLAIQIVCEVPRWKVPAAPTLVSDPVALSRAVSHSENFFREILAYQPPAGNILKEAKKSGKSAVLTTGKAMSAKQLKQLSVEEHLNMYNSIVDGWMTGK